jgi:hypothetical protein
MEDRKLKDEGKKCKRKKRRLVERGGREEIKYKGENRGLTRKEDKKRNRSKCKKRIYVEREERKTRKIKRNGK